MTCEGIFAPLVYLIIRMALWPELQQPRFNLHSPQRHDIEYQGSLLLECNVESQGQTIAFVEQSSALPVPVSMGRLAEKPGGDAPAGGGRNQGSGVV